MNLAFSTNAYTKRPLIDALRGIKRAGFAGVEILADSPHAYPDAIDAALTNEVKRELDKLMKSLGGIKDMNALPDALFVVDVGYHKIGVTEAKKLGIPIIGVVDTNHSPDGIAYVIPGNDDSSRAIRLYARGVADAVLEGKSTVIQEIVQSSDEFVEVKEEASA